MQVPEKNKVLDNSLRLITVAGCLCMVYSVCISAPLATAFYQKLGAKEFSFGLLGGIPIIMVSLQFLGAFLCNRVATRKPIFMILAILSRLLLIPIVLLPFIFPSMSKTSLIYIIILILLASSALSNICSPLWFSWIADLVPGKILNRYWGVRQAWLYVVWTATFLAVIVYSYFVDTNVVLGFLILVVIGVAAGVVDILLFIWVKEPPNTLIVEVPVLRTFIEPLLHLEFRSFIGFSCAWAASCTCGGVFMQLFLLKELEMDVWKASLIWCLIGISFAVSSRKWGKLADRYGQKPVVVLCLIFKPVITIVFIFLTKGNVLWVLPFWFFVDSIADAGLTIASNGLMLKLAPRENRSMFIASITAFSGICSGISAIAAGFFLELISGFTILIFGHLFTNYHILFAISALLRFGCIFLGMRIRDPKSSSTVHVLNDIMGIWPSRFLRFPIGLYRISGLVLGKKDK